MAKVRKLGRREVERGAFLSDEPAWRRVQVRIITTTVAFALFFGALAHGKFLRLWGSAVVYGVESVIVLVIVALIVRRVLASRTPPPEPKDEELELPPAIVEEQLASGMLGPRDLVFERDIWVTLGDSQQFALAAEEPVARERSRAQRLLIVQVAGGLVFALVAVLLVFNLGAVITWLTSD